jgi:hypothetical protein
MPTEQPGPLPLGAPQGAAMSIPSPKEGLKAKGRVEIQQALQLLKKNLNPEVFEVHGQEWKALDSSIRSLSKLVGQEEGKDVSQAGLKLIASTMGPKGMAGMMGGGGGPPGGGMSPGGPMPMALGMGR